MNYENWYILNSVSNHALWQTEIAVVGHLLLAGVAEAVLWHFNCVVTLMFECKIYLSTHGADVIADFALSLFSFAKLRFWIQKVDRTLVLASFTNSVYDVTVYCI